MPRETGVEPVQHDVKQRIMDAAGQLFADKGFDATSITDITEAANVGRALIYYYFKDKRALYDAVFHDGGERIRLIAERAYACKGTAIERLRVFAADFRQLHIDRPNQSRIAMRAQLEGDVAFDKHAREHFHEVSSLLERIIEEGIERAELRAVDPRKAMHMMMGMVHSLIVMAMHGNEDLHPEQDVDFAMSVLANGIAVRP